MRIFRGFDGLPDFGGAVVTMGSYDGVHRGHRALLDRTVALARQTGGQSVVITFDPHPRAVLGNRGEPVELLNTLDEKALLLDSLGADNLIVVPFSLEFSRIRPSDFVRDYLAGRVGVRHLVLGYDHHFGRDHEGNFGLLQRMQAQFGFQVDRVSEQDVEHHKVSSTVIRHLVREGKMERAAQLLGYRYFMILKDGKTQDATKLLPAPGRYAVRLYTTGHLPAAMTFISDAQLDLSDRRGIALTDQPANLSEFIVEFC